MDAVLIFAWILYPVLESLKYLFNNDFSNHVTYILALQGGEVIIKLLVFFFRQRIKYCTFSTNISTNIYSFSRWHHQLPYVDIEKISTFYLHLILISEKMKQYFQKSFIVQEIGVFLMVTENIKYLISFLRILLHIYIVHERILWNKFHFFLSKMYLHKI